MDGGEHVRGHSLHPIIHNFTNVSMNMCEYEHSQVTRVYIYVIALGGGQGVGL